VEHKSGHVSMNLYFKFGYHFFRQGLFSTVAMAKSKSAIAAASASGGGSSPGVQSILEELEHERLKVDSKKTDFNQKRVRKIRENLGYLNQVIH